MSENTPNFKYILLKSFNHKGLKCLIVKKDLEMSIMQRFDKDIPQDYDFKKLSNECYGYVGVTEDSPLYKLSHTDKIFDLDNKRKDFLRDIFAVNTDIAFSGFPEWEKHVIINDSQLIDDDNFKFIKNLPKILSFKANKINEFALRRRNDLIEFFEGCTSDKDLLNKIPSNRVESKFYLMVKEFDDLKNSNPTLTFKDNSKLKGNKYFINKNNKICTYDKTIWYFGITNETDNVDCEFFSPKEFTDVVLKLADKIYGYENNPTILSNYLQIQNSLQNYSLSKKIADKLNESDNFIKLSDSK